MSERIIILGAGESGVGAALLAKSKGYDVFVSDFGTIKGNYKQDLIDNNIHFEENGHSDNLLEGASLVIKSPGIPENTQIVESAVQKKIEIIDELEFGYQHTSKPIIAITGSNGKTTTTLLIHHLLTKSGVNAGLAGNVGHSLARQVIEDSAEVYVVEVSSFQLDAISSFKPSIAILLNITPDHLDRYNYDFDKYANSKMRITKNMQEQDCLIHFEEDDVLHEKVIQLTQKINLAPIGFKKSIKTVGFKSLEGLAIQFKEDQFDVPANLFPLRGEHNVLNMLAAITAVLHYGISKEDVLAHLPSFKNAPNRMEYITSIQGVEFVNDTKATNVEAVYYALGSYSNDIVWIAGGQDKGNDYNQIKELVTKKVKAMVCLGADNKKLTDFFEPIVSNISETQDVKEAARMAFEYAKSTDVVLLSPACASFDLFENYARRGELFKEAVYELKSEIDG
ncbi:MAG: UDP-N-acetylmuramoyl-L-alanine--D-glutamate ligase [Cyclobacteriaceae bacterium]|nr:UDP-N-acetylmuramoyl-L-alanine--D-glutamate ligase [Cyclobacteriaceae bacterium]